MEVTDKTCDTCGWVDVLDPRDSWILSRVSTHCFTCMVKRTKGMSLWFPRGGFNPFLEKRKL